MYDDHLLHWNNDRTHLDPISILHVNDINHHRVIHKKDVKLVKVDVFRIKLHMCDTWDMKEKMQQLVLISIEFWIKMINYFDRC